MDEVKLTERQIEVLQLVADGFSDKEIGERLFISRKTVKNHRQNAYEKIGCHDVGGAMAYCFRNGLVK